MILATHDVELAAEVSHRTVVLADGEIVADGPTREVVTASPAFAPQVAKILAPLPWLTVAQVRATLAVTPDEHRGTRAPDAGRCGLHLRSTFALTVASGFGVLAFGWPFLLHSKADRRQRGAHR